jgi:hypothetical protein
MDLKELGDLFDPFPFFLDPFQVHDFGFMIEEPLVQDGIDQTGHRDPIVEGQGFQFEMNRVQDLDHGKGY